MFLSHHKCVLYSFYCFTSLIHDFAGCSGIKQLLADEVYVAAYPLHEVQSLLFYVPFHTYKYMGWHVNNFLNFGILLFSYVMELSEQ